MKSKSIATIVVCILTTAFEANGALIAAYDFQTTTNGGTAALASAVGTPSPLAYIANIGTATLYLNGTNGSSTFTTGVTNPEVTSFGGTNVNTSGTSLSTVTTGASSLAIASSTANGKRAVFVFSMTDLTALAISYATQGTATGFATQTWSYSTNGTSFTDFATYTKGTVATTYVGVGVVTLDTSALSVLDNTSTVYIGITFAGATNTSGNNRLDNIQITAVPEPASALLGAIGLLGLLRRRR